ncbi:hypothetical protein GCM10023147_43550 [Tsukamurella soli]|uniref:Enterochelin esterase n=2 Tax=Tsukamurella soli TaxID=644556 RepID=A0ABP8KAC2_9ACTN
MRVEWDHAGGEPTVTVGTHTESVPPFVLEDDCTGPILGDPIGTHRDVTFVRRAPRGRWPLLSVDGSGFALMQPAGGGLWWRTESLPEDAVVAYRYAECHPDTDLPDDAELGRRARPDRARGVPRLPALDGGEASVLVMPGAPDWAHWPAWGPDGGRWCPDDLGGGRRCRVRLGSAVPRALLIAFDGDVWSRLPLGAALPPDVDAVAVCGDADPDEATRLVEGAIAAWGRARGLMPRPVTVVAGQGGSTAAAAVVFADRPDLVDAAVVQSPSGPLPVPGDGAGRRVLVHGSRPWAGRYAAGLRGAGAAVEHVAMVGRDGVAWWFPGLLHAVDVLGRPD